MDKTSRSESICTYFKDYISGKTLKERVKKALEEEMLESGEILIPGSEKYSILTDFLHRYSEEYITLSERVEDVVLDDSELFSAIKRQDKDVMAVEQSLGRLMRIAVTPTYNLLGEEVIEASRTTESIVDLMYRKRVTDEQFHEIVKGLAKWHVLDEFLKLFREYDLNSCFASFKERSKHTGRPAENLYAKLDKQRLSQTLENIHQEKYGTTVTDGWYTSQAHTKRFLMACMLSLDKDLYGKMSAFHRFFKEGCGYSFIPLPRTFQNWMKGYRDFDNERTRRLHHPPRFESQKDRDKWLRKERKFAPLEELVAWIRERLTKYGIALA